ncbi:hypothetical protein SRHO_G00177290 [Serrasalmus rhombeus]
MKIFIFTVLLISGSSDITILIVISACVSVALLLIGGSTLVFYKLRYSGFTSRRSGANNEELEVTLLLKEEPKKIRKEGMAKDQCMRVLKKKSRMWL